MSPDSSTVTLSARAAKRIAEILAGEAPATHVRLSVNGGGCSGFQYEFGLDTQKHDDDVVIARDGSSILIDTMSLEFLGGSEIDFTDDLIGAAFKVKNPNATASCGCGTSFSV